MGPRRGFTGIVLDPILPATADAVASGEISGAHADVIIRAVRAIPDDLEADFGRIVERALVEQSRHVHPGLVAKAAEQLLDRIDPDGRALKDDEQRRRREFGLRAHPDGSQTPCGRLTPEAGAVWNSILDSLAKPQPGEDGTPDPRTAGPRRHDALLDAGHRLMRSDLPSTGGTPVTILVLMRIEDFLAGTGTADTSHGQAGPSDRRHSAVALDTGHDSAGCGGEVVVKEPGWVWHDRPRTREGADATDDDPTSAPGPDPLPPAWRNPPRHRLGRRRTHRPHQPHVRLPPQKRRSLGLGLPHHQRHPRMDATTLARPQPNTPKK